MSELTTKKKCETKIRKRRLKRNSSFDLTSNCTSWPHEKFPSTWSIQCERILLIRTTTLLFYSRKPFQVHLKKSKLSSSPQKQKTSVICLKNQNIVILRQWRKKKWRLKLLSIINLERRKSENFLSFFVLLFFNLLSNKVENVVKFHHGLWSLRFISLELLGHGFSVIDLLFPLNINLSPASGQVFISTVQREFHPKIMCLTLLFRW